MRTASDIHAWRMRWVVAATLIAGCQHSNHDAAARRVITWPPHRTLAYDLSLVTTTELPAQPSFELALTATLELSVLSQDADRVELAIQLREPKLVARTGAQDPEFGRPELRKIEQDLAKPAWLELAAGAV